MLENAIQSYVLSSTMFLRRVSTTIRRSVSGGKQKSSGNPKIFLEIGRLRETRSKGVKFWEILRFWGEFLANIRDDFLLHTVLLKQHLLELSPPRRSYLPLNEYTGFMRKIPVSCSRFSKQDVNCCASRSRLVAYWSILSPHRCARLFCKDSILSKVENTPSSRLPLCFRLCSKKKKYEGI